MFLKLAYSLLCKSHSLGLFIKQLRSNKRPGHTVNGNHIICGVNNLIH
jgi:hypothetical protein